MARISSYAVDSNVELNDKILGTDSQGLVTKNFDFNAIKAWLNNTAAVGIVGQNNYRFQTISGTPVLRDPGTISFSAIGGDDTPFADITSMVFSQYSADGSVATNYIDTLVGKQVVLMQLNNLDNFGIYNLNTYAPLEGEPGFFTATFTLVASNGNLIAEENYGFAIYGLQSAGGTWGGITGTVTNQTDLVDYIEEQIAEIPTPTLQTVTDEGAITTNTVKAAGLTVTGTFKNYDEATPDIGAKQDNDLRGYGNGYISDKTLAFVRLSEQAKEEEGAVRIKQGAFQAYINSGWQTVVSNFRFREDANGGYELEHKPVGFEWWIEVNSGNSDLLGLNGLPLVQQYKVSMGAYPVPLTLDGGTF